MIADYDKYYHVFNTDYLNRENENSDWIHSNELSKNILILNNNKQKSSPK